MASWYQAMKYVPSLMTVISAVGAYTAHRDESVLAEELVDAILQITGSGSINRADLSKKVGELIQVFENGGVF